MGMVERVFTLKADSDGNAEVFTPYLNNLYLHTIRFMNPTAASGRTRLPAGIDIRIDDLYVDGTVASWKTLVNSFNGNKAVIGTADLDYPIWSYQYPISADSLWSDSNVVWTDLYQCYNNLKITLFPPRNDRNVVNGAEVDVGIILTDKLTHGKGGDYPEGFYPIGG